MPYASFLKPHADASPLAAYLHDYVSSSLLEAWSKERGHARRSAMRLDDSIRKPMPRLAMDMTASRSAVGPSTGLAAVSAPHQHRRTPHRQNATEIYCMPSSAAMGSILATLILAVLRLTCLFQSYMPPN